MKTHLRKTMSMRPALLGAAVLAISLAGCTSLADLAPTSSEITPSNRPVTVDAVRSGRLARIGATQHPRILASYGGEYSNPKLERTVAGIVGRLVTVSDNPSQVYQVTILNSPLVNAFALPGGYLYVSRGLLALANDSAELAAVLAHEMAHVTANHGVLRQRKEAEAGLANRVVNEVLSQSEQGRKALARNQLELARFSRIQELEADAIGIAAMGEAGFDPYAAADFQKTMSAFSALRSNSAADNMIDFLSTHPSTPQRVELALGHARKFGPREPNADRQRDTYLRGIDGMLYGDDASEGFVRGQTYAHKGLGIQFEFPEAFVIENRPDAIIGSRTSDGAAVRFDGVDLDRRTPLTSYLASGWVEGLDTNSIKAASINGLQAAIAKAQVGTWAFDITVIRTGTQVYRILTAVPVTGVDVETVASGVRQTFRQLSAAEKAALRPLQVTIIRARAGDTAASLAARLEGVTKNEAFFRTFNGLGPNDPIVAGNAYKIVTE